MILLVTVIFIGEEWLSLLRLLKTGLLRQMCLKKLFEIVKKKYILTIRFFCRKWQSIKDV